MASPAEPPADIRQLGRPRIYVLGEVPPRLAQWHSPRLNRWERLNVLAGTLAIERLDAAGVRSERLAAGAARWLAPGVRWRLANLSADARFEFEIHAEPQTEPPLRPLRSAVLNEAVRVEVANARELTSLISGLVAGERRLVRGRFDLHTLFDGIWGRNAGAIFWHSLSVDADGFVALVARSEQNFGLVEYMGRDHAVIEAALAGALGGEAESTRWLHATLARHLAIEEELLFPAYVAAGGREAWVRGLKNEHAHLRQYLGELENPASQRKFLRLLDGHDEKEERVVYPDILTHLGDDASDLLTHAIGLNTKTYSA